MNIFSVARRQPRESRPSRRDRREEARDRWPASLWRDTNRRFHFQSPGTDIDADVLIIGAGLSGLWTAVLLKEHDPSLNVVVLEAQQPGFGASGRNGGWCSALIPVDHAVIAGTHGDVAAISLQQHMFRAVDEIGSRIAAYGINCDWHKGGSLTVATNPAHVERLRHEIESLNNFGFGPGDMRWLDAGELAARVTVHGAEGATFTPHCAALNPYKLVDGLVQQAIDAGVRIHGGTTVTRIGKGYAEARGDHGLVFATAGSIVVATEAYAVRNKDSRRSVAPLYSYVVATDPLPESVWREIGWSGRETLADGRNMITYAQRTGDGRIVFGGRGAPYKFGSDIHSDHDTSGSVHDSIIETMHTLLPATRGVRISHRWGGPLGVPRDWHPSVREDSRTGALHMGGYVGDGVALSYLTARIVVARLTGTDSELLSLPLNQHQSPEWEREPLRWIGINTGLLATRLADRFEERTGRQSRLLNALLRLF